MNTINDASRKLAGVAVSTMAFLGLLTASAGAQIVIQNPNWEIALSNAGYSDYLGDLTPGFAGREYLSGEWGAAIGYRVGASTVAPIWLERDFIYPDWTTNSNFSTVSPLALAGLNAAGLPIATSTIANGTLRIEQRIEMLDTLAGTPLGRSPASAGGAGSFLLSNRYVMQQSYTVANQSLETVNDVQLFQLLHGLNAQSGVYDNRIYPGAMSNYRYAATFQGRDDTAATGQFDYIGFKSMVAPTAFEIGAYGIEGTDNHLTGKPSDGVHLSIENNWTGSYASRNGRDAYAPSVRWVAGGQRWDLGTLGPGEATTLDVMLAIRTGWLVSGGEDQSGSAGGGSLVPGGLDFSFESISGEGGKLFSTFSVLRPGEVEDMIAEGEFGPLTFFAPSAKLQLFDVDFEGSFSGTVRLTFGYDPSALPDGFDEQTLRVYHWDDDVGRWEDLGGTIDPLNHTITVFTDQLSPFAVATAVPEPEGYAMMLVGIGLVAWRLRRAAKRSSTGRGRLSKQASISS